MEFALKRSAGSLTPKTSLESLTGSPRHLWKPVTEESLTGSPRHLWGIGKILWRRGDGFFPNWWKLKRSMWSQVLVSFHLWSKEELVCACLSVHLQYMKTTKVAVLTFALLWWVNFKSTKLNETNIFRLWAGFHSGNGIIEKGEVGIEAIVCWLVWISFEPVDFEPATIVWTRKPNCFLRS